MSPLPARLQSEIVRAHRRLGGPIPVNPIDLLGYQIWFMGESQLRYLFDEIFIQASYFFKADTDRPLIIDCGSNIGMSLLFFKMLYPKARIIGFEPDPSTFETLRRNVIQNRLSDVELHQVALTDREGSVELFRDESPDSSCLRMSILRERHPGPSVTVPSRKLSGFISSEVDLIKIDIEGAEEAVIGDLVSNGKLQYAKQLHLEYHHHIDAAADKLSSMLRSIEASGFGYQLRADVIGMWPAEGSFQDVSVYCYRKH
jgi:FkbM family methyltransferase